METSKKGHHLKQEAGGTASGEASRAHALDILLRIPQGDIVGRTALNLVMLSTRARRPLD